jgi:hypothetical protein
VDVEYELLADGGTCGCRAVGERVCVLVGLLRGFEARAQGRDGLVEVGRCADDVLGEFGISRVQAFQGAAVEGRQAKEAKLPFLRYLLGTGPAQLQAVRGTSPPIQFHPKAFPHRKRLQWTVLELQLCELRLRDDEGNDRDCGQLAQTKYPTTSRKTSMDAGGPPPP